MELEFDAKNWMFFSLLRRASGERGAPADGDAARELYLHFADRIDRGEQLIPAEKEALSYALRRLATYYTSEPYTVTPVTAFLPNDRRAVAAPGAKPVSRLPQICEIVQRVDSILEDKPGMKVTTAMRQVAIENLLAEGPLPKDDAKKRRAMEKHLKRVKRAWYEYHAARNPRAEEI
ncbi:hypothetical protein [Dokdonella sp.]|uniref:hypothetical protein n=1 Tax=Dokdonella sp. TaxID=2291710 RepID=UPI001B0F57AC|nr:hypothetical protein [Dokdonella sp.]MBO9664955.1 hypothetical protein [Dokdonella sp.]